MAQGGTVCPQCATVLAPGTRFCGECGARIPAPAVETPLDASHTILGIDAEAVKFAAALAEAEAKAEAEARAKAEAEAKAKAEAEARAKAEAKAKAEAEARAKAETHEPQSAPDRATAEPTDADAAKSDEPSDPLPQTGSSITQDAGVIDADVPPQSAAEPGDASADAEPSSGGRSAAAAFAPERGTPAAARAAVQNARRGLAHTMLGLSDEVIRAATGAGTLPDEKNARDAQNAQEASHGSAFVGAVAPGAAGSRSAGRSAPKATLLGIQMGPPASQSRPLDQTQVEGEPLQDSALEAALATTAAQTPLSSTRVEGSHATARTALGMGVAQTEAKPNPAKGRTMLGVPLASLPPAPSAEPAGVAAPRTSPSIRPSQSGASVPPRAPGRGLGRARIALGLALLALLAVLAMVYLRISNHSREANVSARIVASSDGESLLFEVPNAPQGSRIRFGGQEQALVGGKATFALASDSLRVGENVVLADVVSPDGETASARIVLSVFYRIWVDTSGLRIDKPNVDVVVTAVPGTQVTLDGEAVKLDAQGRATKRSPVDLSHVGKGGVIEHVVRYRMQPPQGEAVVDELHTRIPVAMLQIDRPGPDSVTDRESIEVAGAVGRDTQVDIDGAAVPVKDGRFSHALELPKPGEYRPRVTATAPGKVPYAVTLNIKRVRDLAQAAREFDFDKDLNYAKLADNAAQYRGRPIAMEGRVYATDPRPGSSVIQMLARPCSSAQRCSVWVVDPQGSDVAVDRWIRVLGIVDGEQQFRSEKNEIVTVPKIIARFVLPAKP